MKRKLVLQDGRVWVGHGFGNTKDEAIAEIVFNTTMAGYQEILSDPSYTDQMICMTYPLVGNYGITDEDYESKIVSPRGFIVREYNDKPSNFRYTKTLNEWLEENSIVGLTHVDTREITQTIRDEGSMIGLICDEDTDIETAMKKLHDYPLPHDQVSKVSCRKVWYSRTRNPKHNVVAVDCGIKYNIIRQLNSRGCNVIVVPYNTPYEKILHMNPDGVLLSNGPGDPEDVQPVIELIQKLQGTVPLFGICLGHQMIALANGLHTYKMKFGHRGGNHPVMNMDTGKIEITSQNHSFAVKQDEHMDPKIRVTHINLLDRTVEGLAIDSDFCFSVQYHPESAPGPEDSSYLFSQFIQNMNAFKGGAR